MYEYNCQLDRVIDGDTVDVHIDLGFGVALLSQRVRLCGIDTPECRTTDDEEKKYGLLAKARVQRFFDEADSEAVLISQEFKSGKFGRILGDFHANGARLVQTLLAEHLGVVYYARRARSKLEEEHLLNRKWLANPQGGVT